MEVQRDAQAVEPGAAAVAVLPDEVVVAQLGEAAEQQDAAVAPARPWAAEVLLLEVLFLRQAPERP